MFRALSQDILFFNCIFSSGSRHARGNDVQEKQAFWERLLVLNTCGAQIQDVSQLKRVYVKEFR